MGYCGGMGQDGMSGLEKRRKIRTDRETGVEKKEGYVDETNRGCR